MQFYFLVNEMERRSERNRSRRFFWGGGAYVLSPLLCYSDQGSWLQIQRSSEGSQK
jgi:hypothetical protein